MNAETLEVLLLIAAECERNREWTGPDARKDHTTRELVDTLCKHAEWATSADTNAEARRRLVMAAAVAVYAAERLAKD